MTAYDHDQNWLTQGHSFGRQIGTQMHEVDDDGVPGIEGRVGVRPSLLGPQGIGLGAGAMLAVTDAVGGLNGGLAVLPRWVVSTNQRLRVVRLEHVGPVRLRSRILRTGRHAVVAAVDVVDEGADDALVATAVVTSAALEPVNGAPKWERPARLNPPEPPPLPHRLRDELGMNRVEGGVDGDVRVLMDLTDRVLNPWGIMHGGVIGLLVEAVAEEVVPGGALTDAVVHFLRPGRVGPVEARAVVLGERPDGTVLEIEIHDLGADRVMSVATATVAATR
jgi:uncharacterized protein (TIGR00369 family)